MHELITKYIDALPANRTSFIEKEKDIDELIRLNNRLYIHFFLLSIFNFPISAHPKDITAAVIPPIIEAVLNPKPNILNMLIIIPEIAEAVKPPYIEHIKIGINL